jgi:exonuclease III
MNKLQIIQYNCGNTNATASRALFDSFTQPRVLAIQEPSYNRYTRSTYCPKPYQLAYEALPATRVCFMIRRDIPISHWKRTQYGPNTAALQIQTDEALTTIINVYNPRGNAPSIGEWPRVQEAIANAKGEIILLGDFNTHHSQWGGIGIACEQQGDHLLNATKREGLQLLTQQGEITWKRGDQESTIDLTFATQALSTRVEYCGTEDQWALTQDHIPIKITLDLRVSDEPQETHTRYALKKLNLEGLSNDLQRS